jgi:hypothetical protein
MDTYLTNWQGGLVYDFAEKFYAAVLYKRENTRKTAFTLAENRFTLEGGWKTELRKDLTVDCRLRTEIRNFDDGLENNHLRFRFRIRFKSKLKIGKLNLEPFIATEPFADNLKNSVFRNRFYLGTYIVIRKNVKLNIGYIRQDTRDKETLQILNSGVDIKF